MIPTHIMSLISCITFARLGARPSGKTVLDFRTPLNGFRTPGLAPASAGEQPSDPGQPVLIDGTRT